MVVWFLTLVLNADPLALQFITEAPDKKTCERVAQQLAHEHNQTFMCIPIAMELV